MLFVVGSAGDICFNLKWVRKTRVVVIKRGWAKTRVSVIKQVIPSQKHAIVEGNNLVKKHIKHGQGHEGGIFIVEALLHSNSSMVG
ncbi:hypothetical protein TB2_027621 [Malus domestica]